MLDFDFVNAVYTSPCFCFFVCLFKIIIKYSISLFLSSSVTWNALVVGFEIFECSRTRVTEDVGTGQNTAIRLLIAPVTKREQRLEQRY